MGWETHGYASTEEFFQQCGNGEFIFAERDKKEYFIKRFPKYVFPKESLLKKGDKGILDRQARCQEYYNRCEKINSKVNAIAGEDGNLVICVDMFIEKNKIYKVYRKMEHLEIEQEVFPTKYDPDTIDRLMRGVLSSIGTLHNAGVVHGDIKYDNIFFVGDESHPRCVVTDFDDSYMADNIPNAEDIVGSPEYYSPELGDYIVKDKKNDSEEARRIGIASDIFALGILYYVYLTGEYPKHDEKHCYAALLKGQSLTLDKKIGKKRYNLISWMLEKDPAKRPAMCNLVLQAIKNDSSDVPNYWPEPEKKEVKRPAEPAKAKVEKFALQTIDGETSKPVTGVKIAVYSADGSRRISEGSVNEYGIWGTLLKAGDYQIHLVGVPDGYERKAVLLSKADFGTDGFAKKRIILKKKAVKVYKVNILVQDTHSARIKTGVFQVMTSDKTRVLSDRFTEGVIAIPALKEGNYYLAVKAADERYKPRVVQINTSGWKTLDTVNLGISLESDVEEGTIVRLDPPISNVCAYQNLNNGFYELIYSDGSKKRVKERIAKVTLDL